MIKDTIFQRRFDTIERFKFDDKVASVFEDMLVRSIPFYSEIHKIIVDVALKTIRPNDRIYDLGCSTGTTLGLIHEALKQRPVPAGEEIHYIGIDNSPSMIEKCEGSLYPQNFAKLTLSCGDIQNYPLQMSGLVIMNYTLQFIPLEDRKPLLKRIFDSLRPGALFILTEKIESNSPIAQDFLTDLYYDFKKRNGYSELEISQKREALENVLIPLKPEQQIQLMKDSGFQNVDTIFRCYNFACFMGIK